MLTICRTCNKNVTVGKENIYVVRPDGNGRDFVPNEQLKQTRSAAKKNNTWDQEYEKWAVGYIRQLKNDPQARSLLNLCYRMHRAGAEVCLSFGENEAWQYSTRRIITALLIGAGIMPSHVSCGHELTADEVIEMLPLYKAYKNA